jgi:hypothetical protein
MSDEPTDAAGRFDPLAGSVMYDLIDAHPDAMTTDAICAKVQRETSNTSERAEVLGALGVLVRDGLATQEGDRFTATTACVRADALSF